MEALEERTKLSMLFEEARNVNIEEVKKVLSSLNQEERTLISNNILDTLYDKEICRSLGISYCDFSGNDIVKAKYFVYLHNVKG